MYTIGFNKTNQLLFSHFSLGQFARILISLAVFSSYCLCLFVCLEIIWNLVKNKFPSNPKKANYFVKLIMALITGKF